MRYKWENKPHELYPITYLQGASRAKLSQGAALKRNSTLLS